MTLPMPSPGPSYLGSRVKSAPEKRSQHGLQACLVVGVHELDAVAVGEAMVRGVEIAAVVARRLIARVVQHRVHAVLVRQREVEDLELDRDAPARAVRAELDRAAV